MKRALLAAFASIALAGGLTACGTATPYQALDPKNVEAGGYSQSQLDASHWRVLFTGNTLTSRETVERYLLFRAAELTANQGYDWFMEDDQHTDKTTSLYVDPYYGSWAYGYGWRPYWRFRGGFYGGWGGYWGPGYGPWGHDPFGPTYIDTYNRYEVSAAITMGHGPKPDAKALDAHQVMDNLGPGIVRPKT
jgi:hypothetical protein